MDAKFGRKDETELINALRHINVLDQKRLSKIAKKKVIGKNRHDQS